MIGAEGREVAGGPSSSRGVAGMMTALRAPLYGYTAVDSELRGSTF